MREGPRRTICTPGHGVFMHRHCTELEPAGACSPVSAVIRSSVSERRRPFAGDASPKHHVRLRFLHRFSGGPKMAISADGADGSAGSPPHAVWWPSTYEFPVFLE